LIIGEGYSQEKFWAAIRKHFGDAGRDDDHRKKGGPSKLVVPNGQNLVSKKPLNDANIPELTAQIQVRMIVNDGAGVKTSACEAAQALKVAAATLAQEVLNHPQLIAAPAVKLPLPVGLAAPNNPSRSTRLQKAQTSEDTEDTEEEAEASDESHETEAYSSDSDADK
jgi:hypothetical protein